jgi:hypothetical protein
MKNLLTFTILLIAGVAFAQDTIVRNDSAKIVAKVLTIDGKTITYQRHNNPDGPTYLIYKSEVARIRYADGFTEKFGKRASDAVVFRKNAVSITITDAVSGMLTLNYERIFWNDIGVRVQASRGMLASKYPVNNGGYWYSGNYYYSRFKPLSVGLDIHYYVHKSANISYYVGSLMEYGQNQQCDYWGCFPAPSPNEPRIVEYYMAGLTNGVALRSNGPLSLDLYTTLGFMREYRWDELEAAARFGFNVGYRF